MKMSDGIGRLAKQAGLALFFASALFFTSIVPLGVYSLGYLGLIVFALGLLANMLAFGVLAIRTPKRFSLAVALIYLLFFVLSALSKYVPSVILHFLLLTFPLAWLTYANRMKFGEALQALRIHKRSLLLLVLLGAATTVFVLYPIVIAEGLILRFLGVQDMGKVSDVITNAPLWLAAFSFLVAPFSEEVFFRGFLYGRLKGLVGKVAPEKVAMLASVLATTVLFAAAHYSYGSITEIVGAFTIGLIFMAIFIFTDSLAAVIAAHAVFNFISVAVVYLANYFGSAVPVGLLH
jgi:membrane protease YdiL (CAAX protease family)